MVSVRGGRRHTGEFRALDVVAPASTISGLARLVMSPASAKLEIPAITRCMIFPERVLGMSGKIHTFRRSRSASRMCA